MKKIYYSVPDSLVGKYVDVKIYSEKIVVFSEGKKVATHERKYKHGSWSVKLEHYISTLTKKPGAVHSSLALRESDDAIKRLYNECFRDTPRDFVLLVDYISKSKYTAEDVIDAYTYLKTRDIEHPSVDQIKLSLTNKEEAKLSVISDYDSVEFKIIEDKSISTLTSLTCIMNNKDFGHDVRAY